jgi:hypothetical protein
MHPKAGNKLKIEALVAIATPPKELNPAPEYAKHQGFTFSTIVSQDKSFESTICYNCGKKGHILLNGRF